MEDTNYRLKLCFKDESFTYKIVKPDKRNHCFTHNIRPNPRLELY